MLKLFAFSKFRFDKDKKALALLKALDRGPFPPTHFDRAEPVRRKLDDAGRNQAALLLSGAPEHDGGSIFLSSKKPHSIFVFRWMPEVVSDWYAEFKDDILSQKEEQDSLVSFLTTLFRNFPVIFGGVAAEEDWNAKHWIVETHEDGEDSIKVGLDLERCIPGIYWMTVFGAELVSHFGRDVILSAPDCETIDLGEAGVVLLLKVSPTEGNQDQRARQEQAIVNVLGAKYFFDIAKPDRPCASIPAIHVPSSSS